MEERGVCGKRPNGAVICAEQVEGQGKHTSYFIHVWRVGFAGEDIS